MLVSICSAYVTERGFIVDSHWAPTVLTWDPIHSQSHHSRPRHVQLGCPFGPGDISLNLDTSDEVFQFRVIIFAEGPITQGSKHDHHSRLQQEYISTGYTHITKRCENSEIAYYSRLTNAVVVEAT